MRRNLARLLTVGVAAATVIVGTALPSQAGGTCADVNAPGGGYAYVCKSWILHPGQSYYYYGDWNVVEASSGVYVQKSEDGAVATVTSRGGTNFDSYEWVHAFYLRACNSGCSGWW